MCVKETNLAMLQKVRSVCKKLSIDNVDVKSPAHLQARDRLQSFTLHDNKAIKDNRVFPHKKHGVAANLSHLLANLIKHNIIW